jgi:hypothetical protein
VKKCGPSTYFAYFKSRRPSLCGHMKDFKKAWPLPWYHDWLPIAPLCALLASNNQFFKLPLSFCTRPMSLICPTVGKLFSAKVAKNIYDVPLMCLCRCCCRQNNTKKNDQLSKNEEALKIHHATCKIHMILSIKHWVSVRYASHI